MGEHVAGSEEVIEERGNRSRYSRPRDKKRFRT